MFRVWVEGLDASGPRVRVCRSGFESTALVLGFRAKSWV